MRVCILIGVMAWSTAGWAPAAAQVSNSPLYPPSAPSVPDPTLPIYPVYPIYPAYPPWPNAAPTYTPAPRYPTDSRNLSLDNRAPAVWPARPDVGDATPRLGSPNRDSRPGVERMR